MFQCASQQVGKSRKLCQQDSKLVPVYAVIHNESHPHAWMTRILLSPNEKKDISKYRRKVCYTECIQNIKVCKLIVNSNQMYHVHLFQAINAVPYGVVGVLVYTDPGDMNDGLMSDANETYPHSWYLPPSGVERGSFNTHYGDLLTPYLAAKGNQSLL